jgi:ubiquinol-cytochrome c reductase iron-sulfur subunit
MKQPTERKSSTPRKLMDVTRDTVRLLGEIFNSLGGMLTSLTGATPQPPPVQAMEAPVAVPESGRATDHETESEAEVERNERWGTLLVVIAFGAALAGGFGFLFAYWWNRSNQLLGGSLALFFGGIGFGLIFWSHLLMLHKEAVEPREVLPSTPAQRESTEEAFCAGVHNVRRRSLLKWMGAGSAAMFVPMALSLLRSLGMSPDKFLYDRVWKRGQRLVTMDGKPLSLDSLQPGSSVTVFPEDSIGSEKSQTVLVRVLEQSLQMPSDRAGWTPAGYVAYSRVCTHAGCPVGQFEAERSILLCPCHQSTFDVLRAAAPTGGPAARPLPQLPLYADADGTLRAGGGFTAPPGPGFWGMP